MASNIQTSIVHVFGQATEKYVLMAILAGAIALITDYLGYTTVAAGALVGAFLAGVSAAVAQYASTGSIPGTSIPLVSLIQLGLGALLVVIERYASQTVWTTPTLLAAVLLFLSTLLSEVQAIPQTQAGSTPTPPAAGPPASQ